MEPKTIKTILVSQNAPEDISKSPYKALIEKHRIEVTFYKFFDVVGIGVKEFRKHRVIHTDYTGVIFTSRIAVDHYFRLAKEMRISIPEDMKYFCSSEKIANYLQNYIQYRKRKIFFGESTFQDLVDLLLKHKEEKFIFPCAEEITNNNFKILDKVKINYTPSPMYRSEIKDLTNDIDLKKFDMVVLFSPVGVKALTTSFPDSKAYEHITFSAFGTMAQKSLKDAGIMVTVPSPTEEAPSVVMAIEQYITKTPEEKAEHIKSMQEIFQKKTPRKSTPTTPVKKARSAAKKSTTASSASKKE